MKTARQTEILSLIRDLTIETQEQMLELLQARGFSVTQATISRDIKELRLVKELHQGVYRYVTSERRSDGSILGKLRNIFKEGVISIEVAQNIVVVKTMPGLASAACSALDNMDISGMVGSLAGDDTGMLIMRDQDAAQTFASQIHKLLD